MWEVDGVAKTSIEVLDGGVHCNVVSPAAWALVRNGAGAGEYERILKEKEYMGSASDEGDRVRIQVSGKEAHASMPEAGENATVRLLEIISLAVEDNLAKHLHDCFHDINGRGAGLDYDIEPMGKLTMNLGILKIRNNTVSAQIDCRYPYGITADILTGKIQETLKPLKVTLKYDDKPTLTDKDSPWLKILLDTYREISGDTDAKPVISGGVTYSKAVKNCVAFGPGRRVTRYWLTRPMRGLKLKALKQLFEVYATAMARLAAW